MTPRATQQPRDWGAWMDRINWVLVVRGASTGFTVLVLVGLASLVVFKQNLLAGLIFLGVGVVVAFVVAAWRAREADSPVFTGAVAALMSYLLAVPLVYLSQHGLDYLPLLAFAAVPLVVGAVSGFALSRGWVGGGK